MPLMDYRCVLCSHRHRQETKPERCAACGHTIFWAVEAPPPGFSDKAASQGEAWLKEHKEETNAV